MMIVFKEDIDSKHQEEVVRLLQMYGESENGRFSIAHEGNLIVVKTIKKGKLHGKIVESVSPILE